MSDMLNVMSIHLDRIEVFDCRYIFLARAIAVEKEQRQRAEVSERSEVRSFLIQ